MTRRPHPRRRQSHNISLSPDESRALRYLAGQWYGDDQGALLKGAQSQTVQKLVRREIIAQLGDQWREALATLPVPEREIRLPPPPLAP